MSSTKSVLRNLDSQGIKLLCWKNTHEILDALNGNEDLDVLARCQEMESIKRTFSGHSFKEARNSWIRYPYVSHFYGWDTSLDKIVHFHVYEKLVTGESHTKNYLFPFAEHFFSEPLETIYPALVLPSPERLMALFTVRYLVKASSLPELLLLFRKSKNIRKEFDDILRRLPANFEPQVLEELRLFHIRPDLAEKILLEFHDPGISFQKVLLGLRLRFVLRSFSRYGIISSFLARYGQLLYRVFNRLGFNRKKRLISGGKVIAICGPDGSGKSTIRNELSTWLGQYFDIHDAHPGLPILIRNLIFFREMVRPRKGKFVSKASIQASSLPGALKAIVVALSRQRVLKKISRLKAKGYLVLCDRYISTTAGAMDGPRIRVTGQSGALVRYFAWLENQIYSKLPPADLVIRLDVPVEELQKRNSERTKTGKETDEEIVCRAQEFLRTNYPARRAFTINAGGSLTETTSQIKSCLWPEI